MKTENLLINHYKIINEIGRGNKGIVYKVYNLFTGKILALKVLFPEIGNILSKNYIKKQFFKLTNFEHKNLVKIYDFGISNNKEYYFTMELLKGKTLKELKKIDEKTAYQIIYQISYALKYLHFNDLIHFNIKPSNVILIEKNGFIEVKLLDFGLSQYNIIDEKDVSKSINYIAPEIIKVKKVDKRVDFYSLGAILYELLTGKLPFAAEGLQDLINHYLEKEPLSPRKINPDISLELSDMILKLLSKNPNNRYNNALDIIEEINILMKKNKATSECASRYNNKIKMSNNFVGRKNELKILEQSLKENAKENGKLFIIRGESGIGKTYLLQRFKSYCQLENTSLIIGQCDNSNNISYKPVIEILKQLIIILENIQRKDITEKFKKMLIKLVPELKDKVDCKDLVKEDIYEIQLPKETEKTVLIKKIYQFLLETKKIFSYVIAIEDFHLVDNETLDIIRYFLVDSPLLTLVTCREEEINNNEELKKLIKAFKGDDFYKEITLKRFNFNETKLMINLVLQSHSVEDRLISLIYKNTFGNPFFMREEIISLINEHILYQDEGNLVLNEENYKAIKLSSNLKELIGTRIKNLDSKAVEVLEILSIVKMKVKENLMKLLCEMSSLNLEDMQEILDNLASKYILVERNNLWSFYHPRTREVVESNIDSEKKEILHQRVGEVLEQTYKKSGKINSKLEELAYHFVNGTNKEKALSYSLKSAEITESIYAHQKTIEHYKNILSISPTDKLREKLALVYELIGKYDESIAYWKIVLRNCEDEKERINICIRIARTYTVKGHYKKALFYFEDAKKRLLRFETKASKEVSKLHLEMGSYYYQRGYLKEATLESEKALQTLNDTDHKILSSIYNLLGSISFVKHNYEQSMMYYKKTVEISEEIGDKIGIAKYYHNIGNVYGDKGEVNRAINYYNKCLENKMIMDNDFLEHIHHNLGFSYLQKKDYDLANSHLLKSLQLAKQIGYYIGVINNYDSLGELYYEKAMYNLALDYLNKSLELSNDINTGSYLFSIYLNLAKVYLGLDEIDESFKYCQKALELAEYENIPGRKGNIYRILGLIHQKKQEYQKAEEYFKKSEDILTKLESNINLAKTHHYAFYLHKKRAKLHLEKARKIYKELDLLKDLELAVKELKWINEEKMEDVQKYKTLYEVTQMITSILALNQLLPIVVDKIIEVTNAKRGFLLLLDEEAELHLKVAHKSDKKDISDASKKIDWNIIKKVSKFKKSILIKMPSEKNKNSKKNESNIMCTPLITKNRIVGIIYVDNKSRMKIFSNSDLDFFETFANQIAISIENAILYEKLLKREKEASEFKTINQLKIAPFNVKKVPKEIDKVISISQKIYEKNINESGFGNIIGKNSKMLKIYNLMSKVAVYDINVLIEGESGTGKEMVSEEIHKLSKRKSGKLIKINAANLNKDLLESELFGYEKGAFTGAYKSKKGKLELADKGTLFLDEIGEIPFNLQAKFLRTLETKSFYKVGGNNLIYSDFRLICATNLDLKDIVSKNKFREDLYYRIYKFVIKTPPLRERKEDISLLFKYFIENNRIAKEKRIKHIDKKAWQIIEEYDYPGNVRELLSILEGAVILCEDEQIRLEHLPKYLTEKVKDNIEEKYQKILGEKELIETLNTEKKSVDSQSLVKTHSNTSLQFNNLNSLQENMNTLLTNIIREKINLQEKGCVKKLYQQLEKEIILYLLEKLDGNIIKLSQIINISYSTLKRKLKNENYSKMKLDEKYEENTSLKELIKLIKLIIDNSIANNKKVYLISSIEKKFIETTLSEMDWKRKDVCMLLETNSRTLNKKISKYTIRK